MLFVTPLHSRQRRHGRRWVTLGLASTVAMVPLATGQAGANLTDDKQAVDAQIDDAYDEVLSFNKKVAKATRQVLDAREQLPSAQANLAKAEAAASEASAAHQEAKQELEAAATRALRTEEQLADLEAAISSLRGDVGDFARRAYQMGPFAELEMLLDAKDPSDFTDRLAAIRNVSKSNNDALNEMADSRADMAYMEERLRAVREEAQQQQARAQERLDAARQAEAGAQAAKDLVDNLVQQEQTALKSAQAGQAEVKAQYEQLAAEQARIAEEIAQAARKLERQTGVKTGTGGGVDVGGQWLFPVAGASIGSNAGWRFHPILHYTRCHAGADIGAGSGTPIAAVADGVVVQAGYSGGYGNFTVISHGGGLTSGYGHQSSIIVKAGQTVKRGQIIGYVGSTGLSSGPHLHFEARVDGDPYDPKGWFGQGAKVRVCV